VNGGYPCVGAGGGLLFPLAVTSIPNKAIWPYVQQWHFDVQKEFPGNFVVTTSYVGSKGTHLTLLTDGNQVLPVSASANPYVAAGAPITPPITNAAGVTTYAGDCSTFTVGPGGPPVTGQAATNLNVACGNLATNALARTLFPGYDDIANLRNEANSTYHALQVTARKTVGNLQLSLAYTYSHSIDDSSDRFDNAFVNSFDVASNRASSNFDLRHNLAISYIYGLPFFKGTGLVNKVLGGWQVSGITIAQTGTPFSVKNGTTYGDNAGVANGSGTGSRPDLVGAPKTVTAAQKAAEAGTFGPLYYNDAAFAIPIGLTFGNVGRNTLYLPGRLNFDFGLFKQFKFTERTGLDFRWENFNVFNHTQFNAVDNTLGDSAFLHLNGTHDPRRMQFGLRLYF